MVKAKYPACVIVFGGPQVRDDDLSNWPFIDRIVLQEGEKKFVKLLAELSGTTVDCEAHDLNDFPSPYSRGLYDYVFEKYPEMTFQAIVETNRGCPFSCDFCYWGQAFDIKKVRHRSIEYVREEAEWIAKNQIKYVFMADANYGMFPRDLEVAQVYADVRQRFNYPDKVRVCWGKNREEQVFQTALVFSKAGVAKGITLARQSNDLQVLKNISRSNIKLDVYSKLQERYQAAGIPTYTEIILGLPGETVESFKKGVEEIVGSPTQLFIYHCSILPNTEMAKPEYLAKHGIKTVRVPLAEIHCEIRKPDNVVEYEDIVIATNTMSVHEWMTCAVYSWITQLRYSFDTIATPDEISRFWEIAYEITQGASRGQEDRRFGNIYWEPEEIAFLRIKLADGTIDPTCSKDLEVFAKEVVLYGRKSKVHQPPLGP
jgi:putative methyltransferase